jgi:hypothetical protein
MTKLPGSLNPHSVLTPEVGQGDFSRSNRFFHLAKGMMKREVQRNSETL